MKTLNKEAFIENNKFSYIPLVKTSKITAVTEWQKYSDILSDYPIEKLLNNNVGIVTGPASGTLVVDVDNPNLFASFLRRNRFGINKDFMVRTGKGYHLYNKYPGDGKEYRSKTYGIYGFDIRGVGGYVVAPFSIHEPTGKTYEIVNDGNIPDAPDWLLKYCFDVDRSAVPKIDKLNISNEIRNFIKSGAEEGGRSEAIMSVLNSLINNKLDDDQIFYIFNTFKIGAKYIDKPAGIRDQWLQEQIDKAKDYVVTPVISYVSGRELLDKDCKVEWLIPDLIEKLGHTLITAKSGMGKSIFSLNLAVALATGQQNGFMGYVINKPLRVVIIQCENSEAFMKHRLERLVKKAPEYHDAIDKIDFPYFDGRHDSPNVKLANKNIEAIIDKIHHDKKPDVIILDPYKSYSGVEENSNDRNRDVLDNYFSILAKHGITTIIIHHEGKTHDMYGTDRARGASTITDAISNHWSIRRKDDKETNSANLVISCEKARNYKKFDDIYLEVVDGVYFKHMVDPFDPKVVADIISDSGGSVETQQELLKLVSERMEVGQPKARQLINTAVTSKYIEAEKYGPNKLRYTLPVIFKKVA